MVRGRLVEVGVRVRVRARIRVRVRVRVGVRVGVRVRVRVPDGRWHAVTMLLLEDEGGRLDILALVGGGTEGWALC